MLKKQTPDVPDGEAVSCAAFRERMRGCDDTVFTEIVVNEARSVKVTAIFIDGMVTASTVYDFILKPLTRDRLFTQARTEREVLDGILRGRIYHGQHRLCETMTDAMKELLFGAAVLVFDGCAAAVAFDSKGFERRGTSEPTSENVLKGSKESFVESIRANTSLVRRRMQSCALKIHHLTVGRRTNTPVALVYMEGIANSATVEAVRKRFEGVDMDGLVTAGQVESVIYAKSRNLLPQALYTERPDKFVGCIIEGRVGIIVDGIPIAYITPIDINSLMQAPEDYAHHFLLGSFFRILRYTCTFAALVLPAFYVSVTTFHQEMIPTKLAVSIISSKQHVPFPTYMEVLLMLLAFEVLLEAGMRLPRAAGQTVSIVGALVVGQAAITANMLSPGVVIVIAAAGITGFAMPSQDLSNVNRIFRIILVLLSAVGGLFTTTLGLILIFYNMCNIEIFGTPYLSPFVGNEGRQMLDDTLLRHEWFSKTERPVNINPEDLIRQGPGNTESDGETR
ncbi:MAG: spore germination protein [Oscillospiraceae bacterium]|jgi:spore germination protein KA|nr:spore germination protein [Oscillospiraceae bacterium]